MKRFRASAQTGAASIAFAALALGCGKETPSPQHAPRGESHPIASAVPPDSELTRYVQWHRAWRLLTNRHMAELDAESERISAAYSYAASSGIAQDPGLLALLERQRAESQPLMSRAPRGLTAQALDATLPGIGRLVITPRGMIFEPGRNEAALAAARERYGAQFVSWVLAHEATIVDGLTADR